MSAYKEDLLAAMNSQVDLIKKQTMLEIIQIVSVCDTFEEFKRAMYGRALEFMREFEAEGTLKPGTVDKIVNEKK